MPLKLPKNPKQLTPQVDSSLSFMDRVQKSLDRTREAHAIKMARLEAKGSIPEIELRKIWTREMKRIDSDHLAVLPDKEFTILKVHLRKIRQAGQNMEEYLVWCMQNWNAIISKAFSKMPNKPEYPIIGFIVKFTAIFQNAFAARLKDEKRMALGPREITIRRLVEEGRTREEAEFMFDNPSTPPKQVTLNSAIREEIRKLAGERRKAKRLRPVVRGQGTFGSYENLIEQLSQGGTLGSNLT